MTSSFCGLFSLFAMKSNCSVGTRDGQKSQLCCKRRKNVMLARIHGSVLCDVETFHNNRGERCTKAIVDRMTRRRDLAGAAGFLTPHPQ